MGVSLAPFHGLQAVRGPDREAIALRLLGLAEEEVRLVEAVEWPVRGHFRAAEFGERGEHVHAMHDLVAHALGGNLAGPANQEGHANSCLHSGGILPAPRT